ncbi:MAG: FAD-dependent oxidoreductase [Clostridiales bacterium]|nr:FAD-dependent oxidoreductase [Clostridiales bacterium]
MKKNDLSRRDFLKGSTAGLLGLASVGLLTSCGSSSGGSSETTAAAAEETESSAAAADESASAGGDSISWDYEADVVVIGAGGSGLPAALKAMEDGASVLIVEANYDCGGHAAVSEGQLHSGGKTLSQKEWNVTDSADLYYYDHTRGTSFDSRYNNRSYARSVANSMAECYEFILNKGIIVQDIEPMVRDFYRDGGYDADGIARMTYVDATAWVNDITGMKNNGIGVTRPLEQSLRENGAQFLMNYHMDKIYREETFSGKVLGIQATYTPTILPGETEPLVGFMSEGNIESTQASINVKANKGVIICSGGSIGNQTFRTMIDPRLGPEFDGLAGMPFSDQDASGEIAAMQIGAGLSSMAGYMQDLGAAIVPAARMGCQYGYGNGFDENSKVWKLFRSRGIVPDYDSMIIVNMLGSRCGNEDLCKSGRLAASYDYFATAFCSVFIDEKGDGNAECYGGPLWAIFDQAAADRNDWDMDNAVDYDNGYAFKADTIEDLAKAVVNKYYEDIKMDPDTLADTIARYNQFVDAGKDDDWGKTSLGNKIEQGPFYCVWATPSLHDTLGGLRTDGSMQVIDLKGERIPGLFCAGESSGGMHVHGLGRVITSGYIAGRSAASVDADGYSTADTSLNPNYAGDETSDLTKTDKAEYFSFRGASLGTSTNSDKQAELASLGLATAAASSDAEAETEAETETETEAASGEVYTGTSDKGMGGAVQVQITVEDGKMTAIEVVKQNETPAIGTVAFDPLIEEALKAQSADIDAVSGATITSEAFKEALSKAMEKAGL